VVVVMLFAAFEPDLPGSQGAALVGLGAGEPLSQHGSGKNADLVGAGGQFRERDGLFEPLDALDDSKLLTVDLDDNFGECSASEWGNVDRPEDGAFLGRSRRVCKR
jgi:hypothetical protein